MTKEELRVYLEQQTKRHTEIYGGEIVTHAPRAPVKYEQTRLRKACETRKAEAPVLKENWENYLNQLADGTYKPQHQPSEDLWDTEGLFKQPE